MSQLKIRSKLKKNIIDYCELNGLDFNDFLNNLIEKSFMIEKYGEKPPFFLDEYEESMTVVNDKVDEVTMSIGSEISEKVDTNVKVVKKRRL